MHERRQKTRTKTFLGGRLFFNHRRSTMDCVLKNLGEQGAKVVFHNAATVPDRFEIEVAQRDTTYQARVAWRGQHELGVTFVEPHSAAVSNVIPLDLAIRMHKLQADKDRLERRVSQLTSGE